MTKFCYRHFLVLTIVIGFIAALVIGWQRHQIEANNTIVEMVIDYEDITELAKTQGVPEKQLMQQFKQVGITTLAVYETNLEKLQKNGKVTVTAGAKLIDDYRMGMLQESSWRQMLEKGDIKPEEIYLAATNQTVFNELKADLERRLGAQRVTVLTQGNRLVLSIKANYEKVIKWNLGLPTDEMKEVNSNGFYVMARPTNYNKVKPDDVKAVFERLNGINASGMMFVADEVLGFPGSIKKTAEELKKRDMVLSMIEHPLQLQFYKQEGLLELARLLDYQAARVYSIGKDEQPKLKVEEAVHRWAITTDQERNIRVNLLHKYDKPEAGEDLLETNLRYVIMVKEELLAKGFKIDRASTFSPYFPSAWLQLITIIGALATVILLLSQLTTISPRIAILLLAGGGLLASFMLLKGDSLLTRQLAALAVANVFPVLSIAWVLSRWQKLKLASRGLLNIITESIVGITVATAISLAGGFFVGALLSDIRFFLEIDIFRGVKLTFVLPVILVSLVFLRNYKQDTQAQTKVNSIGTWLRKALNYHLQIKSVLLLAFAGLAAYIYIGRSGHTAGIPVTGLEIKLRYVLEEMMYARPRGKEFLIGHPAFFLAVMALYHRWPQLAYYGLIVLATIGQGSMVETFAHLRTPIFISFIRGVDGWILGLIVGIAAAIVVQLISGCSRLLGRRPA